MALKATAAVAEALVWVCFAIPLLAFFATIYALILPFIILDRVIRFFVGTLRPSSSRSGMG